MKKVRDVVSEGDFVNLMERCRAAAHARGGVFMLDEFHMIAGERQHARYLRDLATEVGVEALAEQLDPDDFEPGPMERLLGDQVSEPRMNSPRK